MGHFNKFDKGRGGFNKDRGGSRFSAKGGPASGWDRRGDGPKQMHHATCSECGQDCEVPFRPTGDRPVYCSNCFKSKGAPARSFAQKRFEPASASSELRRGEGGGVSKAQIDSLNVKLDKILSLLSVGQVEAPKEAEPKTKEKKSAVKKIKTSVKKAKGKK